MRATLTWTLLFATVALGQSGPDYGHTLDGQEVRSLAGSTTKAVVLFFVASDCPVSNRTFPEMKRVHEEFSGRGVQFWYVYPNAGEVSKDVSAHQSGYDADGTVVLDPDGKLTRLAGATVTPEAVVLVAQSLGPGAPQWKPVYAGRVDNRYVRLGLERTQATEHFAEHAIQEVLDGQPVTKDAGALVGCGIMTGMPAARKKEAR